MPDQLTSSGLTIKTLEERIDDISSSIRSNINANEDLSPGTPIGQIMRIIASEIQSIAELAQASHSSFDPEDASGQTLEAVSALTGTVKQGATKGTVTLTVNLDAGATLAAGKIAGVSSDPDNPWETDVAVTNGGGAPADFPVAATAVNAGRYVALAASIDTIITPSVGWNSVTNAADAIPGEDIEEDEDLRDRRENQVSIPGSTNLDSIVANVLNVDNVVSVLGLENKTELIDANNIPPKSFHIVVWDSAGAATNADIVEAIWDRKPAGIRSFGATSVTHTDTQGRDHSVSFSRATVVNILAECSISTNDDYVSGSADTAINDFIENSKVAAAQRINDLVAAVDGVVGVEYVVYGTMKISRKPAATAAADIILDDDEKAMVDVLAADITVTVI